MKHRLARTLAILLAFATTSIATSSLAQEVDFDALTPGNVLTYAPPITLSHSELGTDLVVSTGMPTTSDANYLGAAYLLGPSNDDQDLFLPGDVLTLNLDVPATWIALSVVSTPGTPAGAFELVTPIGNMISLPAPNAMAGEDEVFYLGVGGSQAFTQVELRASADTEHLFGFHVDDIVVPEPGLGGMLALGTLVLAGRRSGRRAFRQHPTETPHVMRRTA